MPGPFGQRNLWEIITGQGENPAAIEAEKARQAAIIQRAIAEREAQRALQARVPKPGVPMPAPAPGAGGQGYHEPDIVHGLRTALGGVLAPVENFFNLEGPVPNAFRAVQGDVRKAASEALSTPASRERAAAAKPKPAQQQALAFQGGSQPSQGSQPSMQPQQGGWNPFAGFATIPGGEPGASRDGGSRTHQGRDYSGMTVGTAVPAPPMGARLVGSGSDSKSGNWGKWQTADGGMLSIAHLVSKPTEPVVGPGQPLGFLGNTGNASTRGTNRAVAHVRTWGPDGKEVDPAMAFGGGGQQGGGDRLAAIRGAITSGAPVPPAAREEGINAAQGFISQAMKNDATPFSFSYQEPTAPELPKPQLAIQPNYAPADEAFANAAPRNPFGDTPEEQEKQQLKMRRAGYFAGIAGALSRFQEGTGIGQLLANVGGMALQGRLKGDEDVRAQMEQFDSNMARYNLAMANREEGKAKDFANVANSNITTMNRFAEQQYGKAMKTFEENRPQLDASGQNLVTSNLDPVTGVMTKTSTPVDPRAMNKYLLMFGQLERERAGLRTDADRLAFDAASAQHRAMIPFAIAEATKVGDWQSRDQLIAYGAADVSHKLVQQGTWADAMAKVPGGRQAAAAMEADAWNAAGVEVDPKTGRPSLLGGKVSEIQQERHDNYIASNLVGYFLDTGHIADLVGGVVKRVKTGTDERVPGYPNSFYQNPLPEVAQSVQAFDAAHTKRTQRETAKGTFGSEMYNPR